MPYIVALAAPPGGGKSALARALADVLQDAATMDVDSYERLTERPVHEIVQRMEDGSLYEDLDLSTLPDDLGRLRRGETVIEPVTGREIRAKTYLILETNFGREHSPTAGLIDLLIWIDTPLDVALARKMRQLGEARLAEGSDRGCREHLLWLQGYLEQYLGAVRPLLHVQRERIRASADVVIHGERPLAEMAREAARAVAAGFAGMNRHA